MNVTTGTLPLEILGRFIQCSHHFKVGVSKMLLTKIQQNTATVELTGENVPPDSPICKIDLSMEKGVIKNIRLIPFGKS